ncbi:N-glycosylase/DNA lyase [Candidatus Woesearchaeota archaeon]|nr:N-glycosylase/DNA lyase [Candidatus Woesearchaeota archaeon]
MKSLLNSIETLKKSFVKSEVDKRIKEFENNKDYFSELCYCLLTANFNAERSIKIQNILNKDFHKLTEKQLAKKLKSLGHRFPNTRAKYISEAKKHKENLKDILQIANKTTLREWLVNNIKGLGYKEASHFLRNIGYKDYAIIDFHILDLLEENKLIKKQKTINKKTYIEIENVLKKLANQTKLNLAELDLYLWYLETNKILK